MFLTIFQWIYVAIVVLVLFNLTIFFHELGHFLVGRRRKALIERFAIWFGPALWKKVINGVEYRLGCIPLGGYVLFPQLAMEAIEGKVETPAETIKPLRPRDKIPILFAGSAANFVFGILIACLLWAVGIPKDESFFDLTIGYVEEGTVEYAAGIRSHDRIVSINGKPVHDWEEVTHRVALSLSSGIRLGLERNGQVVKAELTPERDRLFKVRRLDLEHASVPVAKGVDPEWVAYQAGLRAGDQFLELNGEKLLSISHLIRRIQAHGGQPVKLVLLREGKRVEIEVTPTCREGSKVPSIGIELASQTEGTQIVHSPPWQQITKAMLMMVDTFNALLHTRQTGVGVGDLAGPGFILGILVIKTLEDIRLTLEFLVLLNINLAILNLLPIPVLDGGHILFSVIEAIRRKPLNQKFVEITQTVFAALIIALMIYVTFNDFHRFAKIHNSRRAPPSSTAPPASTNAPSQR